MNQPPPPTDEKIERLAMLLATAKEGTALWPDHLVNVERDIYRVKAMEFYALMQKGVSML